MFRKREFDCTAASAMGSLPTRRALVCAGSLFAALTMVPLARGLAEAPVQATAWVDLHAGSRIRLVAAPGATVLAGIEIQMAKGWKTYWRTPGEAGVPPQFQWQGSSNVAAVEVLYPAPERLVDPAAESIGYKNTVLIPAKVRKTDASGPVTLKLEAEFGLCNDICVPIETTLTLPVPAAPASEPAPSAIASALAQVPRPLAERRPSDPAIVRTTATLTGSTPKLVVEARFPAGDKGADLFVEAPESIYVPLPKAPAKAADGTMRFEIPLPAGTAQDLRGKPLTLTVVSAGGSVWSTWQLP